jgi:hypothetical protein
MVAPEATRVLLNYQLAEHYQLPVAATAAVMTDQVVVVTADPVVVQHM